MNMLKGLKEDMNKCLNEDCKNTELNEMKKSFQDMKIEIEPLEKCKLK